MGKHKHFYLGIKGLIKDKNGKILLLLKNPKGLENLNLSNRKRREYWDLPGGRVKIGGSIEETLKREVEEELNLLEFKNRGLFDAVISKIDNTKTGNGLILFVYTCDPIGNFEVRLSSEDVEFGWFSRQEAIEKLRVNYPEEFLRKLV